MPFSQLRWHSLVDRPVEENSPPDSNSNEQLSFLLLLQKPTILWMIHFGMMRVLLVSNRNAKICQISYWKIQKEQKIEEDEEKKRTKHAKIVIKNGQPNPTNTKTKPKTLSRDIYCCCCCFRPFYSTNGNKRNGSINNSPFYCVKCVYGHIWAKRRAISLILRAHDSINNCVTFIFITVIR